MLIDTHAHLEMIDGVGEVVERAREGSIERVVAVSSDLNSSKKSVGLASVFPQVFSAVGIHPHESSGFSSEVLSEIEKLALGEKVVAIGETGLDLHYNHSPLVAQVLSFRKHIELSIRLDLPLVIHIRDAFEDVLKILKEEDSSNSKGVIHCFTGNYKTAKKFIDLGFYISFSGIITFKKAEEIREAAKKIPLDRMLIETDSPYLAPVPFRGKRNEPAYVKFVAEKIAGIRGTTLEKIGEITTANANALFMFSNQTHFQTSIAY